jgi:hypothetical protein
MLIPMDLQENRRLSCGLDITREHYARNNVALPSDLMDPEWSIISRVVPSASHVCRLRKQAMRQTLLEAVIRRPRHKCQKYANPSRSHQRGDLVN